MEKRILIIQDISAIGRVSMSVALPILSSCGHMTSILPTALLSTHSGGFKDFSFLDLSQEMGKIINHWKKEDIRMDGIQIGYLGSAQQAQIVEKSLGLAKEGASILLDPAMADKGKLYSKIGPDMIEAMKRLCHKASILVPNLTEAAFLLDQPYEDRPDDQAYILQLARGLYKEYGCQSIIITGVSQDGQGYGAACYDGASDRIDYCQSTKVPGHYYGTGDIFASVLHGALQRGDSLLEAGQIAVDYTQRCIQQSYDQGLPQRYGVAFEQNLPWLMGKLNLY